MTPAVVGGASHEAARLGAAERARLSAMLLAVVRPEFRVEVLIPAPGDLMLGTPPCRVDGCPHRQRHRGLCHAHHQRWKRQGRPDLDRFVAAADPHRGWATVGHPMPGRVVPLWRRPPWAVCPPS